VVAGRGYSVYLGVGVSGPVHSYLDSLQVTWLQGPRSRARLDAMADGIEVERIRSIEAAKVGMPGIAPADALAWIASERGIIVGDQESEEEIRAHALAAWALGEAHGRAAGMLVALYLAGWPYDTLAISQQNGVIHKLVQWPPDPMAPWDAVQVYTLHDVPWRGYPWDPVDVRDEWASTFWVMAKGSPDDAPAALVEKLTSVVNAFKPAQTRFAGFYVASGGANFGHWQYITGDQTGDIALMVEVLDEPITGQIYRLPADVEDYVIAFDVAATVGHGVEYSVGWTTPVTNPMLTCTAHTESGTEIVVCPVDGTVTTTAATIRASDAFDGTIVVHVAAKKV